MPNFDDTPEKFTDETVTDHFKGVWIPVEIWDHEDLSLSEKCLASMIHSLDNGKQGCWASNAYLARRLKVSESAIQKSLANLKKLGIVKQIHFNGRSRFLRSYVSSPELWCEAEVEKIPPLRSKKIYPCSRKKSTHIEKSINKNYNKEERESAPDSSIPKKKKTIPKKETLQEKRDRWLAEGKKLHFESVYLSDKEVESLNEKLGQYAYYYMHRLNTHIMKNEEVNEIYRSHYQTVLHFHREDEIKGRLPTLTQAPATKIADSTDFKKKYKKDIIKVIDRYLKALEKYSHISGVQEYLKKAREFYIKLYILDQDETYYFPCCWYYGDKNAAEETNPRYIVDLDRFTRELKDDLDRFNPEQNKKLNEA